MKYIARNKLSVALALAMGSGMAPAVHAQEQGGLMLEEVIVTARRVEERLQDVPISITVLSQQQMSNANITNMGDIALYTPSLSVNSRFGEDLTSFAIRGFTQELRTTSSVGVYFAEVVAPRGSNSQVSGDGAGPGMMFDLVNIQVLKGPQGTLFGRNTTGGAVIITPQKPTDVFEGYVEATAGDYDLQQLQGVINIPVTDNFRLRFGVDSKERDGYLDSFNDIGPDKFADVDYIAGRASAIWDITDTLENYTVLSYAESDTNGSFPTTSDCKTSAEGGGFFGGFIGDLCQEQLERQAAAGHTDFWDTSQALPNPYSEMEEWRVVNTTAWEINDNLTFRNILGYAELNTRNNTGIWGNDYRFQPYLSPDPEFYLPFKFAASGARGDGKDITDSSSFVWEGQLQGLSFNDRLTWQAGLYYEKTEPEDITGQSSPSTIACDYATIESGDPDDWRCNDIFAGATVLGLIQSGALPFDAYQNEAAYLGAPVRVGSISITSDWVEYTTEAMYAQGTYDITDQWAVTAGIRYTWDEVEGSQERLVVRFPYDPLLGELFAPESISESTPKDETAKSDEPTWVLGLDYKPTVDSLLYAKYSRGYRQGSVNASSQPGLLVHEPEQVDTYEIGTKLFFSGSVPANFNAAVFYNDFQDQQLQNGLLLSQEFGGVGSTAIVNAGSSEIFGVEIDGTVQLFDSLLFTLAYAYLDTEVTEVEDFTEVIAATGARPSTIAAAEGDELPFTPKHSLVASANYRLPFSSDWGDMTLGATYVYTDEMRVYSSQVVSPLTVLPDYELWNFNFSWQGIFGSGFDVSAFLNNAFEEEYYVYSTGNLNTLESDGGSPGHPRMYGVRLRYNFGGE